jgi:hypothetical protein
MVAEQWPLASEWDSALACNSDTIEKRARGDQPGFVPARLLDGSQVRSLALRRAELSIGEASAKAAERELG